MCRSTEPTRGLAMRYDMKHRNSRNLSALGRALAIIALLSLSAGFSVGCDRQSVTVPADEDDDNHDDPDTDGSEDPDTEGPAEHDEEGHGPDDDMELIETG